MNNQTSAKLKQLNSEFYNDIASHFDMTRQILWRGYEALFIQLKAQNFIPSSILDIACGNGRFVKSIQENLNTDFQYFGIDNNAFLIDHATSEFKNPNINFKQIDIFSNFETKIKQKYDLVVAFGLMHHIPSPKERIKFLNQLKSLLNPDGRIVFTTWNFNTIKLFQTRLNELEIANLGIEINELEPNDYFLRWDNSINNIRYCHYYQADEVSLLLKETGFTVENKFDADGKDGKTNTYYIVKSLL